MLDEFNFSVTVSFSVSFQKTILRHEGETESKMKANASKSLLLATFLIIGQAIAVHNMIVVDVVEYFEYAISQSPTRGYKRSVQPPELVEYWMKQFADSSARVSGPCGMKEDRAGVCDAPPYPYFSLSDERRNELLLRPPPDVLRANIERATNGELATVGELVERVNANIGNLAAVSDNELTLLATNFREPEAGLVAKFRCGPRKYGVWPEDLLVSQDEQRALVAAFIYVQNDDGYFARRNATLQKLVQEHNAKFMQQCKADTARGTGRFKAKVEQLDLEVILSEAEWLARYEEYVAVLRADLVSNFCFQG